MWGEGFLIPQCSEQLISGFTFVSKRKNIVIFPNVHVLCFKFCQTGKVDPQQPRVSGHRGNVLDIKWNPFNECCIASCSEDATVCTPEHTESIFSEVYWRVVIFMGFEHVAAGRSFYSLQKGARSHSSHSSALTWQMLRTNHCRERGKNLVSGYLF